MNGYLTFDQLILTPPLPAIIALLLVLGFKFIAEFTLKRLFKVESTPILTTISFFFVLTFVSSLIFILSWSLGINVIVLKIFSYFIVSLGIIDLIKSCRKFSMLKKKWDQFIHEPILNKLSFVLLGVILVGLFLSVLGAATDGDSLDYHLGAPLEYLRNGGFYPRFDWLCYRLAGFGEIANMIGLAAGTDNFGSVLQYSSLLMVLYSLLPLIKDKNNKYFFALLVLSSPVLMFLIPNQKPQMLPAVAIIISIVYLLQKREEIKMLDVILIGSTVFYAMANKYSFYIAGSVIFIFLGYHLIRLKKIYLNLIVLIVLYALIILPMQAQKMLFYDNPFSPALSNFFGEGNGPLIRFSNMLMNFRDSRFTFPLNFFLTHTPGRITSIIGLGIVLVFIGFKKQLTKNRPLLIISLVIGILYFLVGARSSRYYFEVFVLLSFSIATIEYSRIKRIASLFLLPQVFVIACFSSFGAYNLFPSALTESLREKSLIKQADYYSVLKWVGENTPEDAVIFTTLLSSSLSRHSIAS